MTAVQEVGMREELGVAELKRRFSELLNRVELKGERIEIRRRGRPVAALVPLAEIEGAMSRATVPNAVSPPPPGSGKIFRTSMAS
jgi:prevent-host-death family protein